MAFYPELKGPALEAHRAMVSLLKRKAMDELQLTEDQIVVRDLRPEDYGSSSADLYYDITQAATWNTVINAQTIADNRWIGVSGFFCGAGTAASSAGALGPNTILTQIRVTRKGSLARYWWVQPVINWADHTGYVDDPFTADPNTTLTLETYDRFNSASHSNWGFIGAVIEKKGVLVSPDGKW
jgi:hypothetical protein